MVVEAGMEASPTHFERRQVKEVAKSVGQAFQKEGLR